MLSNDEIVWLPPAPDGNTYGYLPEKVNWKLRSDYNMPPGLWYQPPVWVMLAVGSRAVHRLDRLVEARSDYAYVMSASRETIRVDGRAICPHCGMSYYDHTPIKADGFESFYKACNGSILKT